uniref:RRM domain-containing protein n=1 Tax=Meloidogyne enterolobii TaxID=390850 RepID=A0A6V7VJI2_MELEN|nr:unnamed protein product [Meloidogyne enterolobii]
MPSVENKTLDSVSEQMAGMALTSTERNNKQQVEDRERDGSNNSGNDQATNDKTENNGYDSKTINEQNEIVVEDSDEPNDDGTEQKKIFCGGISYDTTGDDLASHFSQFGSIKEAQVKYDRMTGRSRGFAFVEFETVDGCRASLTLREQTIKGKQCEIKPAKTREVGYMNKKVFVGGLPIDFSENELREHFQQYGRVEDVEWPLDKVSKARKSFAFVVFESEEAAEKAAAHPKHHFADRECDVKKAVPQSRRPHFGGIGNFSRSTGGGLLLRGGYGGGGIRCPASGGGGGNSAYLTGGGGGGDSHLHHQQHHQPQHQMQLYYPPHQAAQTSAAAWYHQMNATAAWYNAAYNGGAWYGAAPTAASSTAVAAPQFPT